MDNTSLSRRRLLAGFSLSALLPLAGCQGKSYFYLGINGLRVTETDAGYQITGELALSGKMGDVSVEDSSILVSFGDGTRRRRIPLGDINGREGPRKVDFDEQVEDIPQCVFTRYENINHPGISIGRIEAYVRSDDSFESVETNIDETFESCEALAEEHQERMSNK